MARSILRAGKIAGVVIVAIIVVAAVLYSAGVLSIAQTQLPLPDATGEDSPASDAALAEQKELVIACLAGDEPGAAVTAMDKLLTDFAQHEQLPSAVHEIVQKAVEDGKYEAVGEVCRTLAENSSVADSGVWVAMASALAAAYQGDDAATGHLAVNFSGDLRCIEVFAQIAYSFRQQKKYVRAQEFYQHVVDTWPDNPQAVWSQFKLFDIALVASRTMNRPRRHTRRSWNGSGTTTRLQRSWLRSRGLTAGRGDIQILCGYTARSRRTGRIAIRCCLRGGVLFVC